MSLWNELWRDDRGAILTAEMVMVGSVVVLGSVVGLSAASNAVNDELTEVASALRSFDQSFVIAGQSNCRAWKAGSYYIQPRVEVALQELCGVTDTDIVGIRDQIDAQRDLIYGRLDADTPPPNDLPAKKKPAAKAEAQPEKPEKPAMRKKDSDPKKEPKKPAKQKSGSDA